MTQAIPSDRDRRGRLYLIVIILLFAVPLATAWLLVGVWRPAGSMHHGELLDPARPLPALQVKQLDGNSLSLDELRGRWHLVYLGDAEACVESCRTSLHNMRQIRLALGKNAIRLSNLLLTERALGTDLHDWLAMEHPDLRKLIADVEVRSTFRDAFTETGERHSVYLVDPLNNLVMRYGPEVDPGDILDDLERLLKYSKIG
jgi:cytochrome oxidase Cu insertion factor (SCO1/SenC/PrrC family)